MRPGTTNALLAGTASLAVIVSSAWYGAEKGSRGAFTVAGLTLVLWLGYPFAVHIAAWHRHRRIARMNALLELAAASRLFERHGANTCLTRAGERLYRYAVPLVQAIDRLPETFAEEHFGRPMEALTIGAGPTSAAYLLPRYSRVGVKSFLDDRDRDVPLTKSSHGKKTTVFRAAPFGSVPSRDQHKKTRCGNLRKVAD